MNISPLRFNRLEDVIDTETVSQKLLAMIGKVLAAEDAYTTDVQQQMLASHVKAMVKRAQTGEPLPEVDISLFDEVSPDSINMAAKIVETLPNLAVEEVYLLSVHFEIARSNP
ncbi:PRD domain-containing protein [Xenorhabdus szentirmaii]|uniref:PRD domain-containing protein n=2 Tax=Xenorhabdus szentirmaii TaxID=290112 RepID=W1J2S3_9GAMM|nr:MULTISPECIES: PRD domain-containing protein [Xenorhabdus]MBD2780248.1 PRD domain-containing protein [Xenorhabdus sp. 38]MBD2790778.1 PRD domain-containing protein [Xenorhabdus sp. CUL]MBD2800105.1 PRD domain-containing protein [Xenorhabdus sp. M]MBD2804912.1 PRD domain-containing protein [Xenorhabdus sp. ZM]MBD2820632.1 PRD domain-containing protein [Xenorhabdus sp. 42]